MPVGCVHANSGTQPNFLSKRSGQWMIGYRAELQRRNAPFCDACGPGMVFLEVLVRDSTRS